MSDPDRRTTPNAFLGRLGELIEFSSDPNTLDGRQRRRLGVLLSRLVIEVELATGCEAEPLPDFPSGATLASETGAELEAMPPDLIACTQNGVDADIFYVEEKDSPEEELRKATEAKLVCGRCAVQLVCLETALRSGEKHGVWGGATEEERTHILQGEEQEAPASQAYKEAYAALQDRLHVALKAGAELSAHKLDVLDGRVRGMISQFMNPEALLAQAMRAEEAKPASQSLDTLLAKAGLEAYVEVSD